MQRGAQGQIDKKVVGFRIWGTGARKWYCLGFRAQGQESGIVWGLGHRDKKVVAGRVNE